MLALRRVGRAVAEPQHAPHRLRHREIGAQAILRSFDHVNAERLIGQDLRQGRGDPVDRDFEMVGSRNERVRIVHRLTDERGPARSGDQEAETGEVAWDPLNVQQSAGPRHERIARGSPDAARDDHMAEVVELRSDRTERHRSPARRKVKGRSKNKDVDVPVRQRRRQRPGECGVIAERHDLGFDAKRTKRDGSIAARHHHAIHESSGLHRQAGVGATLPLASRVGPDPAHPFGQDAIGESTRGPPERPSPRVVQGSANG